MRNRWTTAGSAVLILSLWTGAPDARAQGGPSPDERLRAPEQNNPEYDRYGNDRERTIEREPGRGGENTHRSSGQLAPAEAEIPGGATEAETTLVRQGALDAASGARAAWWWPLVVVCAVAGIAGAIYARMARR